MKGKAFLDSTKRLFKVTSRPKWKEAWIMIRISLLGVVIIGIIGFIIRILFFFIGLGPE
jgi:protein translocase SEC61 complex gamma subunit